MTQKKNRKTRKKPLDVNALSIQYALSNPEILRYAENIQKIQVTYKKLQKQQQEAASSSG